MVKFIFPRTSFLGRPEVSLSSVFNKTSFQLEFIYIFNEGFYIFLQSLLTRLSRQVIKSTKESKPNV